MVVMPEHEQEWIRFGEAVWIDSTAFNNHLRWNLIPITLCNGAKGLACGGWFVTAVETEEVHRWILEQMILLSEKIRGTRFSVLFIDEDQAQCQAAEALEVPYRLCVHHKYENFKKHLLQLKIDESIVQRAGTLFYRIVETRYAGVQERAISELNELLPERLAPYLEVEFYRLLPHLAEVQRGELPTFGYTSTGLAESANQLIKRCLGEREVHFAELVPRIHFAFVYRTLNQQDQIVRTLRPSTRLGITVAPWLDLKIEAEISQGGHWRILARDDRDPENPVFTMQHHKRPWKMVQASANSCSCGRMTAHLRACKHVIELYRIAGHGYPVHLLHPRWCEIPLEVQAPDIAEPTLDLLDIMAASRLPSAPGSDDESDGDDEELRGVIPAAATGNDVARYKKIFFLGKQLATVGTSLSDPAFQAVVQRLEGLITEFKPGEVDLGDAQGVRKGRPRGSGNSRVRPVVMCEICSGAHVLKKCPHISIFNKHVAEGQDEGSGRSCGLCHHKGHARANCPALFATRQEAGIG